MNIEEKDAKELVDRFINDKTRSLIELLRECKISESQIFLTFLGIASHTEYYNVLYNRVYNQKDTITEEDKNIDVYADDELIIGHLGGEGGEDNAIVGTAIVGKAKVGVA